MNLEIEYIYVRSGNNRNHPKVLFALCRKFSYNNLWNIVQYWFWNLVVNTSLLFLIYILCFIYTIIEGISFGNVKRMWVISIKLCNPFYCTKVLKVETNKLIEDSANRFVCHLIYRKRFRLWSHHRMNSIDDGLIAKNVLL